MSAYGTSIFLITTMLGCTPDKSNNSDDSGETAVIDSGMGTDTAEEEPEPIIWSGPSMVFTKEDFADHTDPANQDAITDKVVLTRSFQGALFNVVLESAADPTSPSGTQWAQGSTDAIADLEFQSLKAAADNRMKDAPGIPFVLHLIEENIYIDVTFLSWSQGGSAGGFSYERSTPN